jgi:oxygen-independent coproporphyrinogen-3 oxidase
MNETSSEQLLRRFNAAVPGYTSYPNINQWEPDSFNVDRWKGSVKMIFRETVSSNGMSLYVHLPFCESLCTYCGCNTRITVNHAVEEPYIEAILSEWHIYLKLFSARPIISELHLGGGTPTFFSGENLVELIRGLKADSVFLPDCAMSFEAHPENTRYEHLKLLYDEGFRGLSLGIQDLDSCVQDAIHRHHTIGQVETITGIARNIGYTSINFDLIYGLPFQSISGLRQTLNTVMKLRPDRISFYSYTHLPWMKPGQRKYTEADLPSVSLKMELYRMACAVFEFFGYTNVGMDLFALPHDALASANRKHNLHRNVMGYSDRHTNLLIGLGASAIGDSWYAFAQNEKIVEQYMQKVLKGELPLLKGHVLDREDLIVRRHILNIMCKGETSWEHFCTHTDAIENARPQLQLMQDEGILELSQTGLKVTSKGKRFLRNICLSIDARHHRSEPELTRNALLV